MVYTSNDGFTGKDSFTFKANDGTVDSNTATVTITVNAVTNPPVADDQKVTANTADPTEITLSATDPGGSALTYAIVSQPKSGTITGLNEDTGSLVYTSNDGFTGKDSFTFKANDGTVDSNTATVTITVNAVTNPPVADDQKVTANTADPTEITLTATDPGGSALTYAIVSQPKSGTITGLNEDTGSLVYTSNDGFTGKDSFTFKANDGTVDSNTATVTITVKAVVSQSVLYLYLYLNLKLKNQPKKSPPPFHPQIKKPPHNHPPPTAKPINLNSTNISSGGSLFSDGFPGFTENMKDLFGN